MDIAKLASIDSVERENFLDEMFSVIENGAVTTSDLEADLLPELFKLGMSGISGSNDDSVFGRTFSTVVLAAVVEWDVVAQRLSSRCLLSIYAFTLNYLKSERDFRGFVNSEKGWAHSVAHISDLISELLVHREFDKEQKLQLLHSYANFIIHDEMPVLVFDEDQRIARALYRALIFEHINSEELGGFFKRLVGANHNWIRKYFTASATLSKLNNIQNICRSLLVMLTTSQSANKQTGMGIEEVLATLRMLDMGFLDDV